MNETKKASPVETNLPRVTQKPERNCSLAFGRLYLNNGQDHKQLKREMRQLKHHAAALRSPLLLPVVQKVWDESPADTDEALLCDYLLPCRIASSVSARYDQNLALIPGA